MLTAYNIEFLGGYCLFPQNFQIKKLGETTVCYPVVTVSQKLK